MFHPQNVFFSFPAGFLFFPRSSSWRPKAWTCPAFASDAKPLTISIPTASRRVRPSWTGSIRPCASTLPSALQVSHVCQSGQVWEIKPAGTEPSPVGPSNHLRRMRVYILIFTILVTTIGINSQRGSSCTLSCLIPMCRAKENTRLWTISADSARVPNTIPICGEPGKDCVKYWRPRCAGAAS